MEFKGFGAHCGPGAPTSFGSTPSFPSLPNPNALDRKIPINPSFQQPLWPQQQQTPLQPTRLWTQVNAPFDNGTSERLKRMRSPPLAVGSNPLIKNLNFVKEPQWSDVSSSRLTTKSSPINIDNSTPHEGPSPVDYSDIYDVEKLSPPKSNYFNAHKRARSPLASDKLSLGSHSSRSDAERPNVSPPKLVNKKNFPINRTNSPSHQSSLPLDYSDIYHVGTLSPPKPTFINPPKRGRSSLPIGSVSLGTSSDPEGEMMAKAKRLARFNVELNQPMENLHDAMRHKSSEATHRQDPLDKKNVDTSGKEAHDFDGESLELSQVVVGLCPDMCPESERKSRERKGDLDKYERLNGERNQTSKFLAVKKYTRTPEQEADFIRPMPVLHKTVDYLLQLLNRPYDENFLGIYNFLWDRMRAIRMDLRMQNLFNYEAIVMLEQMIRLHIIAMHELCEYKKGEGFSEGFDAHLNIEQMNKASVELFQMYDDHRKRGISVQTEKEFRAYYALLKLDKHPGYNVEPAELSHELARMTPEIRCTPDLLFARDVARACRIGNYIAFFRLVRKATHLQACLMHAHFAKVRRQALASLHSGLQHNQGIPISHVVNWLGMEEEDIESLLKYHGFTMKKFDEIYMMKEGPFLNTDTDFPTTCSQLVHFKRSRRIIDDVYSGRTLSEPIEKVVELETVSLTKPVTYSLEARVSPKDEETPHYKDEIYFGRMTELVEEPSPAILTRENVDKIPEGSILMECVDKQQADEGDGDVFIIEEVLPRLEGNIIQTGVTGGSNSLHTIENVSNLAVVRRSLYNEALVFEPNQDGPSNEKLEMIIRKWKHHTSVLREARERRELLTAAALSSLSLGLPIRQTKAPPKHAIEELNIDYVARERHGRQEKSWSGLNVSELVASILSARNPGVGCICWKLVVFVQATPDPTNQLASRWLLEKLRGKGSHGLIASSPHVSIWKKWTGVCCLSVIREAIVQDNQPVIDEDALTGTSCILFVASETIPWEIQRFRLHTLLTAVPAGSRLPLLVVSIDTCKEETISRLGLYDTDRTKIQCFSVVFLVEPLSVFYSDDQLREGLQWLAGHSPVQPPVHEVNVRELVLSYLRHATDDLGNHAHEVSPDLCISAFNETLDRVAGDIITAASANPTHWPCPEIELLEKSSPERKAAQMSLPSLGWSLAARVEPLVRAIKACRLDPWLLKGFGGGSGIHDQKRALEESLTSYLTRASCQLYGDLAAREASVMLQGGAVLEFRDLCYRIVPRWVGIFWRIYNWQLARLSGEEISAAYILEQSPGTVGGGEHRSVCFVLATPSLDEMMEVSYSVPLASEPPCSGPEIMRKDSCVFEADDGGVPCSGPEIVNEDSCVFEADDGGGAGDDQGHGGDSNDEVSKLVGRRERSMAPLREMNDRLTVLLEQCRLRQDKIDEKLAVYF